MEKITFRHGCIFLLLALVTGCIPVSKPSNITTNDKFQTIYPLERGEVIVVYGENATAPKTKSMKGYFTAECDAVAFSGNTVRNLITTILKMNPDPGRFSVKHLTELGIEEIQDCGSKDIASILCQLNLSKDKILKDHLRFAIHVKENIEANVHLPTYAPPFGVASCGKKTTLEANVWDLPTEKFLGSLTVYSEGEHTTYAYMLHIVNYSDTQKDAINKLAREIIEKLTGLTPIEEKVN